MIVANLIRLATGENLHRIDRDENLQIFLGKDYSKFKVFKYRRRNIKWLGKWNNVHFLFYALWPTNTLLWN